MSGQEPVSQELLTWITLRRAHSGGLLRLPSGRVLDGGRPVADYVTDTAARLLAEGLLVLQTLDPDYPGQLRLALTLAGHKAYEALRDGHGDG